MSGQTMLIGQFVENEGLGHKNRPELVLALRMAIKHDAMIVIAKIGRLTESPSFLKALLDSGVDVMLADRPAMRLEHLHDLLDKAEQRSEVIAQRTIAALKRRKAQGVTTLGWANPQRRSEQTTAAATGAARNSAKADLHAQTVMPTILELLSEGQSLHWIAGSLNYRGIATARGGQWYPTTVRNLLKRKVMVLPQTLPDPPKVFLPPEPKPWRRKDRHKFWF